MIADALHHILPLNLAGYFLAPGKPTRYHLQRKGGHVASSLQRFLACLCVLLAVLSIVLWVFSRRGGNEVAIGNLVLRSQKGVTVPLRPPLPETLAAARDLDSDLAPVDPMPRNVIVFIGDGMGIGHLSAAAALLERAGGDLRMTGAPHVALVRTWAANTIATDSAASATAIATGFKTNMKMVGVLPDGRVPRSIFEAARERGLGTGVVTTSGLVDATTACFTAHVDFREKYDEILLQMLASETDVLIGGDWTRYKKTRKNQSYMDLIARTEELGAAHGLEVVRDTAGLQSASPPFAVVYPPREESPEQHGPPLAVSVRRALEVLMAVPEGFVLVVESEVTDSSGHENDIRATLDGVRELDAAVVAALEITAAGSDTLVLVTADHDTGSPALVDGFYDEGEVTVRWASPDHSSQWVPLFAFGPGAEVFDGVIDNTEIAQRMVWLLGLEPLSHMADLQHD